MRKNAPILNIITPVYNEGENFPTLYKELIRDIQVPFRLIVVYDFDEDNTVPVARAYQKKDKRIILHKNKKGKGALNALLSGFEYVENGPILVIMADLSDDLRVVDKMYTMYQNDYDLVCGSRYMKGGKQIGGPFLKRILSRLAGMSLRVFVRFPTHDVTNNFKLYNKAVLNTITIESKGGFEVAMEITVKAYAHGFKIGETPSIWRDRTAGETNFKLWSWLPSYLKWYLYGLKSPWLRRRAERQKAASS